MQIYQTNNQSDNDQIWQSFQNLQYEKYMSCIIAVGQLY